MPDLPQKKVGIVACSGEELPEGTVTRLAALRVLEQLRPEDTVTICLPLFLAGGEGDRAFARFHPTIAVDGCDKRCAARGTEKYSGKPAASVVVTELADGDGLGSARHLSEAGLRVVDTVADRVADLVDRLLGTPSRPRHAAPPEVAPESQLDEAVPATCSCGSGVPVQQVAVGGRSVTLIALPAILRQFRDAGKAPDERTARELLEQVRIYNPVAASEEEAYGEALLKEYAALCEREEAQT
jgi:uncharacterized metal-binding protein